MVHPFHLFRASLILVVALPAFVMNAASGQAVITPQNLSDEHVRKAIDAIVEELYQRRDPQRHWDPARPERGESVRQEGGYTALTALALLHAGQSYQHPNLRDAVEYLETIQMRGSYAISIRAAMWAQLPDKFLPRLETDIGWLVEGYSPKAGGWDYDQNPHMRNYDNSIRQFGALALWEAAKRGGNINPNLWRGIENGLLTSQLEDGAWSYHDGTPGTGSMTTAGLATLFITQDFLHADESLRVRPGAAAEHEQAIAKGLAWLDKHFSSTENPGIFREYYYYMFGVERVALAGGRKYFGERDWFREGATEMINRLCKWDATTRTMVVHEKIRGRGNAGAVRVRYLDFGLLFLSRGRVPVAINKLRVESMAWNNRPRDVANVVSWIGTNTETPVNWQIVDFDTDPEQWLDAPLLYLASHDLLPWLSDDEITAKSYAREMQAYNKRRASGEIPADAPPPVSLDLPAVGKIKRYLDRGGTLLAINETASRKFANTIERLGLLMYPGYEWRTLPKDHWAYTIHAQVKSRRPPLQGLSNGVRELIISSPTGDLARTFQGKDRKKDTYFQTVSNIYFYASEMDRPHPRLANHGDGPDDPPVPDTTVRVGRALYDGNWNPEPAALDRVARHLLVTRGVGVDAVEVALANIANTSPPLDLVMMCGVDRHEFSVAERNAIKAYVDGGGVIFFETVGGRGEFTQSAEEMAAELLGATVESALRTRMVTGEGLAGAPDLTRLDYRPYSLLEAFGSRETSSRLRCMKVSDEPRVLFSREDLSNGVLNQPVWDVSGYAYESARELFGNVIQFADGRSGD